MSTLSENAACIRETTSASTRTSQHKKKKSNFLASLLTLSHFTKTSKSIFWRPNNSARKNIWRKFKNLKFISSTTPDFQQVQSKNEQHCSPFTSRRISREAWTRYIHTESDLKCQKFYFLPVRVKIGQNYKFVVFFLLKNAYNCDENINVTFQTLLIVLNKCI